jgi:beta-lactamase regulating signal transducer with metallopeptidase domain/outer membrane lipoprotein-sorting protein
MHTLTEIERGFGWLLQTTWQAAVLAALVLLAQFLLRNRLSPAWRHGLWFLLLVRLVMPVAPSSAVSIFNLAKWSRAPVAHPSAAMPVPARAEIAAPSLASRPQAYAVQPAPAPRLRREVPPQPVVSAPLPATRPAAVMPPPAKAFDWLGLATLLWLAGALGLAGRFIWANLRFGRRLAGYVPVRDQAFQELFVECAESLEVRQRVTVIATDQVESPAVYGLWRKRLLLPDGLREELTPNELRHVLRHELAHIKRRDPELNCLVVALQMLHWFNPVLWFAFARMRADRELATDELALAHTQRPERGAYGETILKVLEGLSRRPALPGLVGIGESKAQIGERIRAIARGRARPAWRWAAGVLAVVIAGIALTSAQEEQRAKGVDLLQKYPTKLTAGDAVPGKARPWQFSAADIFKVSRFALEVGKDLRLQAGACDLGVGHCADGAVWAVLLPREEGTLTSSAGTNQERVAHVWLRFHPAQIDQLFPPETVSADGQRNLQERMRTIAGAKFHSSWHAGERAMIPEPKDMTVDVDTKGGPRRFFMVDTAAKTVEYVAAFADRSLQATAEPAFVPEVDTNCASVVSVVPANGAQNVGLEQELRIRFDRPMNPYTFKLEWLAGGFQPNGSIQVGPDRKEFIIPVRLMPGQDQTLTLNHDPQREMWARMHKPGKPPPSPFEQGGFKDATGAKANEFRWSFTTQEEPVKAGAPKPHMVKVSPASGSTTPVLTFIELTFDQPMRPPELGFPYLEKRPFMEGPSLIPSFDYDAKAQRFTFPALLRVEDDVRLTVHGFCSAEGVACDPVVLHYQTGTEEIDPQYVARAKAAAKDPKLQKLVTAMKQARAQLKSGSETVQTIHLGRTTNAFNSIEAQTATFRWQGKDQVYADITGPMTMGGAFILGSDGQNCWLYSEDEKGKKRLDQTPSAVTRQEVEILNPFDIANRSVEEVLAQGELVLASNATLEGRTCYRVEKWDVSTEQFVSASQMQWWIDAETFLPRQMVSYSGDWCQIVRFDYQDLNQPLPDSAFRAKAAPGGDAHPLFFEKEPVAGEHRFLTISDGSNGRMSGRLGYHGAGGTTSSGLN